MNKRTQLLELSLFLWTLCPLVNGQATASISGSVLDKTGSVISGASVKATAQSTSGIRQSETDATGHYLMPLLPIGEYTIRVESQGFGPVEQKGIRLQVDEHRELNFTLAPGKVTESVEVSTMDVVVQTSNPTLGQVITAQQVAQLPLNGRNFVQLATLSPGTTQETNPNSFFNGGGSSEVSSRGSYSLSVGGSRASSTDWLLDGGDNNELTAGGIGVVPSIDAIQEFKVLTYNYSAQYGTRAGPTVLLTTKSGSNAWHGSVFEFLRNTSLDARSYFAATREKFNLNQYGFSLGGPVKQDRSFFFVDYQGTTRRQGKPFRGQVPTAKMRMGDFSEPFDGIGPLFNPYSTRVEGTTQVVRDRFMCDGTGQPVAVNPDGTQTGGNPCNIIPQSLMNPIARKMIDLYPLPNVDGTLIGNYINSPSRMLDERSFDVRLDQNLGAADSLFARFSYDQAVVFIPGGSPGFAVESTFSSTQNMENHGRNATLSETHIFSNRTLNQASLGYNRIFNYIDSFGSGTCKSRELGIPGANLGGISCGLTSTLIGGGFWSLGDRGFSPFQGGTNIFTIADSFDIIRGKHNIKVGGEIRAHQMNVETNAFQDGFWLFTESWTNSVLELGPDFFAAGGDGGNSMATFLLGLPDLALHDQTFQGATTGRRWKLFRPYVQDDWRITKNLTLNLGLAWAFVTPITEAQNRQSNFDFATGRFLIPGRNSDARVGVKMDKSAFEPRIGLAWKPFGSYKTAIRAGYAIFHDSSWNQGSQGTWQNPPFYAESNFTAFFPDLCPSETSGCAASLPVTGKSMSEGFPILTQPTTPDVFGGNIQAQDLDFNLGRVQQFNVNVEHQLPKELVITIGYAGSRTSHILVDGMNLNVSPPSACGTVPGYILGCGITSIPYPRFGTIANISDIGRAQYDSLQVKTETKSARRGLYALMSYTYSRAFDSGFADGLGTPAGAVYYPLSGTSKRDWGLSQIHLNHNLVASVIYDLPFGKGKTFGRNWTGVRNAVLGNWEVNLIERITSGFPLFLGASTNASGAMGLGANRPDRLCNGALSHHTVEKFFDTSCFVDPAPGELGNSDRTPLYGPGFVNTDFSALKHFQIREGLDLEFRAEFFNLFNHPQFSMPGQDIDSLTFGRITETVNNPRLIQLALKLRF